MRCDAVQADWWKAEMQQWRTISGERDWKHRHRHHHHYISLLHIIISHHGTSYFIWVRGDSHIIITSPKLPFWKVFQTSSFVAWWRKYFFQPNVKLSHWSLSMQIIREWIGINCSAWHVADDLQSLHCTVQITEVLADHWLGHPWRWWWYENGDIILKDDGRRQWCWR